MKNYLSNSIFYILFCFILLNVYVSSATLLKRKNLNNEENLLRIPLKKQEMSEAHKKKFYDFISESQNEMYTNFLLKNQKMDESGNIKKISLLNFQNIQVIINYFKYLKSSSLSAILQ